MTKQTATPAETITTLREQLAAAEAEQRAAYAASLGELHQQQDAWRKDILARGAAIENALESAEKEHNDASRNAAIAGDLSAAYVEFVKHHASRRARGSIRTQEQGAAEAMGQEPRVRGDLSYFRPKFEDFLDSVIHKSVEAEAAIIIAEYVSPMPTEIPAEA